MKYGSSAKAINIMHVSLYYVTRNFRCIL